VDRRRNPNKRWSHRDIDTREIRILEVVRIETSQVSKHREDLDRPLAETRGRDRARVGISGIGKSEFLRSKEPGTSKVSKSRRNRDRPSGRTRGSDQRHREKSRQEVVDRGLSHRDIGDPGDKLFVHFGIAKRDTPMSGSQLSSLQRRRTVP
jgi:hypothetical protein